jgi:hypothetical protein
MTSGVGSSVLFDVFIICLPVRVRSAMTANGIE